MPPSHSHFEEIRFTSPPGPYLLRTKRFIAHMTSNVSALAGLATYLVATAWALHAGLVGVPSLMGATLLTEPLVATRAAALLHAGVALFAHVAGRSLWGPPPRPIGATHATASALVSLTNGTALWTVVAVCFGVSAAGKLMETAHHAMLLASLTFVPGASLYGCAPGAQW